MLREIGSLQEATQEHALARTERVQSLKLVDAPSPRVHPYYVRYHAVQ
jgi:hypothetical protein